MKPFTQEASIGAWIPDKRDLSDYTKGLHKELEANWSKKIGTYFKEYNLIEPALNDSDTLFKMDQAGKDLLTKLDETLMHDAVLNVAMIWKHIWTKFD